MEVEKPVIVSVGCGEAKVAIQSLGYSLHQMRSWRQLLNSEQIRQARAVVLAPKVLKNYSIDGAVRTFCRQWPLVDIVLWLPEATGNEVRQSLRAGAKEVVLEDSPLSLATAVDQVIEEQQLLPRIIDEQLGEDLQPFRFENMRSRSPKMWDIFETCEQVAPTEATVLIHGETGTGKEVLARAIHKHSQRTGKFVAFNCGAVDENLIDSELFGHVKGAFTGAIADKVGLFQSANNGTLLLDEIGNISIEAQYRLLRVLQEGEVRPVGSHKEIPVNVRVIAATNTPLTSLMEEGKFREDLYYRLNVIQIILPPLRERSNDILFLYSFFTKMFGQHYERARPEASEGFLDALLSHDWPGNVRQLENFVERLLLTHQDTMLTAHDFYKLMRNFEGKDEFGRQENGSRPFDPPSHIEPLSSQTDSVLHVSINPEGSLADNVDPVMEKIERAYLDACFQKFHGRVSKVAEHAGITRRTLLRRMKRYKINKHDYRH